MSVYEIAMLIFFGSAWPFSIYKAIKTRQNGSKSAIFLFCAFIGYCAGITHKIVDNYDGVIYLYLINAAMVFLDLILFYRNRAYCCQIVKAEQAV
jgi:hypothetical protein